MSSAASSTVSDYSYDPVPSHVAALKVNDLVNIRRVRQEAIGPLAVIGVMALQRPTVIHRQARPIAPQEGELR